MHAGWTRNQLKPIQYAKECETFFFLNFHPHTFALVFALFCLLPPAIWLCAIHTHTHASHTYVFICVCLTTPRLYTYIVIKTNDEGNISHYAIVYGMWYWTKLYEKIFSLRCRLPVSSSCSMLLVFVARSSSLCGRKLVLAGAHSLFLFLFSWYSFTFSFHAWCVTETKNHSKVNIYTDFFCSVFSISLVCGFVMQALCAVCLLWIVCVELKWLLNVSKRNEIDVFVHR